jgi:hypothetical protein
MVHCIQCYQSAGSLHSDESLANTSNKQSEKDIKRLDSDLCNNEATTSISRFHHHAMCSAHHVPKSQEEDVFDASTCFLVFHA